LQQGKAFHVLVTEMMGTAAVANTMEELKLYAEKFIEAVERWKKVLSHLISFARQGEIEKYLADANLFMEFSGIITVAWQWLKQGVQAQRALKGLVTSTSASEFYESKMETMKFYFKYELPKTLALTDTLLNPESLTIKSGKEILM
jgi:butyryl-CoA dehydrogenase